ncbi:mannonate dehydratase [Ereboglobus luteus]|uniref:Mannonate dehydratase n=1 Tax=Ereboglobus luteus TaxID=1796921 RepID=A0A2U8E5Y6_9BACT|nr:mannonate dehydratase [Ereboglobus luteus]AWI10246.1 mannonate dehydratase [Ereboglobus luteus]
MTTNKPHYLEESFRWYGPKDSVSLAHIRQTGATNVFSSLHQIPYGELWHREPIHERKRMIETAGLRWGVVESVPVHEDIKTGRGENLERLFNNYRQTLRNLAAEGIHTVVYNFMPVLDWIRTDMRYVLHDGAECLRFDPVQLAAFDINVLERKDAEKDYTPDQVWSANAWWKSLDATARDNFVQGVIDVFPGCKWGLSVEDIRAMFARHAHLDAPMLRAHLARFLEEVIPTAEEVGVRMAIHPDDPPFPVLGLPRIVTSESDIEAILAMVNSPANGLCYCSGSLSALPANDVVKIARRFGPRIHVAHLRSTQRMSDGSFYEADHLGGSVNMPAVMRALLDEQDRRRAEGRPDDTIAFRPDHGHTMLDDLSKPTGITPGYSCIGRMRGLAELRGLMHGLRHAENPQ